jgi:hypothetical protein
MAPSQACQFDCIMMDPPWQLATANPTRGVTLSYPQVSGPDGGPRKRALHRRCVGFAMMQRATHATSHVNTRVVFGLVTSSLRHTSFRFSLLTPFV